MFDAISPQYDQLNRLMTLGIDQGWREQAIKKLADGKPKRILDVATGTGDFAYAALKLNPEKITGVDISAGMLEIGRQKMSRRKVSDRIEMVLGDSEKLDFDNESFDAVTVGFGVRNFENLDQGLREIHRVLSTSGQVAILEPSFPKQFPLKQLFGLYFRGVVPILGRMLTTDRAAYSYLPESVGAFPAGKQFTDICLQAGFTKAQHIPLTFGTCALYLLQK